jgi:hypothetical protein
VGQRVALKRDAQRRGHRDDGGGFSDHGGGTRFFVIAGAIELGTALMTRWDERRLDEALGGYEPLPGTLSPFRLRYEVIGRDA